MTFTIPNFVPHDIRVFCGLGRTALAGCSCGWRGKEPHSGSNPIGKASREFHQHQTEAHAKAAQERAA